MPWRGSFGRILTMQLEPPNDDVVQETLLAKFECLDTWLEFARARGAKGVYRSSVAKLEARLTGDLSLGETTKGAFLDPAQALPLFLKLAYEGDFVPRTVAVPRLALFLTLTRSTAGTIVSSFRSACRTLVHRISLGCNCRSPRILERTTTLLHLQ